MIRRYQHQAFTIVELLIVIVIVAVLAVIATVAYNGIQRRAIESSLSAALNQATKKLEIYKIDNDMYPASGDLNAFGIANDANTTYLYENNSGAYCLVAVKNGISYYVSSSASIPTLGNCSSVSLASVTFSGQNPPNETAVKLFDNQPSTKWFTPAATGWVAFAFSVSVTPTKYSLTSANDMAGRDPKNWTLYGSTDNTNWISLDTQTNQTFLARFTKNTYSIPNSATYKYYKLAITLNNGNSVSTQLADLAIW